MSAVREIAPDIFLLEMPLPFPRLPVVNIYLLRDHEELAMIDCGMNVSGAYETLRGYLAELGVGFQQIRQIVVTHCHPDHVGLSGRVREASGGNLVLHQDDAAVLPSRYVEVDQLLAELRDYLRCHGAPEGEIGEMSDISLSLRSYVTLHRPDTEVLGGERLHVGDTSLDLVWTPGHTAGHVVVYEPARRVLFSGDHLLYKISPNVGKQPQSTLDPLHDFEASLRKVAEYAIDLTAPAHGPTFGQPAERVRELLDHHQARRKRCLEAIGSSSVSAWEVSRLVFSRAQEAFDQRLALFETLAHLEALKQEGMVAEQADDGRSYWRVLPGERAGKLGPSLA
ncbi:MAG: MBL fold metallo-hydrolase [Chloroflexota bacterium]